MTPPVTITLRVHRDAVENLRYGERITTHSRRVCSERGSSGPKKTYSPFPEVAVHPTAHPEQISA